MFLNFVLCLFEQVKILTLSNFFARKLDIMNKFLSAPPFSIEGKKLLFLKISLYNYNKVIFLIYYKYIY